MPLADLERTLNMGVGFVAVVPGEQADRAVARSVELGVPAWVVGEVLADTGETGEEIVRGAKGVDGGAVRVTGTYRA